mgnify:CR=1 FL=1
MRNLFIYLFVFLSIRCGNDLLNVKVVNGPELYSNIKDNNMSSLVLLNIWSTSCIPCIKEFPYIVKLKKRYDISKLDVVFLSTDWDEKSNEVEKFLLSQQVRGQHYRKEEGNTQEFIDDICPSWSGGLPFTAIFNKGLELLAFWHGEKNEKFFISKIDSLLESKGEIL